MGKSRVGHPSRQAAPNRLPRSGPLTYARLDAAAWLWRDPPKSIVRAYRAKDQSSAVHAPHRDLPIGTKDGYHLFALSWREARWTQALGVLSATFSPSELAAR